MVQIHESCGTVRGPGRSRALHRSVALLPFSDASGNRHGRCRQDVQYSSAGCEPKLRHHRDHRNRRPEPQRDSQSHALGAGEDDLSRLWFQQQTCASGRGRQRYSEAVPDLRVARRKHHSTSASERSFDLLAGHRRHYGKILKYVGTKGVSGRRFGDVRE
nr:hypothetical protein [synthetic construct]AXG22114.1 hypothetical protein [synthetic construct]